MRRFARDRRGTVAVILAAALVPVVGAVGVGLDTTRAQMVKARLGQALDAAALAGGRMYHDARRDADIDAFFQANFPPGYMQATVSPIAIHENDVAGELELTVTATIPTTFLAVLGVDTLDVGVRAVARRADKGMELVLVMDTTGSMATANRIGRMRDAARELMRILYDDRQEIAHVYVGVVPYVASVNIGAGRTGWLQAGSLAGLDYLGQATWRGCVEARTGAEELTDAPPTSAPFRPYFWPGGADTGNNWSATTPANNINANTGTGPNLGCGPAVTPLTASRPAVEAAINALVPVYRGGTQSNEGLAWGWRMLSPRWRGLWGGGTPDDLPLDHDDSEMDKVVIVLTDGENQVFRYNNSPQRDYSAYGQHAAGRLGTSNPGTNPAAALNSRTLQLCTAMKAEGVIVYTITFEVNSTAARNTFRDCATSPQHYFDSPSGEDLTQVFRAIGNQLSNLYLVE